MKLHHLVGTLLLPALLIGCGTDHSSTVVNSNISLRNGVAVIRAPNQPDAHITANGELNIKGQSVTLTAQQQDLFKQYYAGVSTIRDQGVATGKAGAALAGLAIGSTLSGLANGNAGKIGPDIQARTKKITEQAALICDDLDRLRVTQDVIASQVVAFQPYATLKADKIEHCRKGLDDANKSLAAHE